MTNLNLTVECCKIFDVFILVSFNACVGFISFLITGTCRKEIRELRTESEIYTDLKLSRLLNEIEKVSLIL